MSEVIYTKCDGMNCEALIAPDCAENEGWSKDDLDADFCPACQKRAADLEANAATAEDLEAFGAAVGAEADKIATKAEELGLEQKVDPPPAKPAPKPLKNVSRAEFDKTLNEVVRDLRKDMKKRKMRKDFIDQAEKSCREQAAPLRPKE